MSIFRKISIWYQQILDRIHYYVGATPFRANIILRGAIVYLIIFCIIIPIHKRFKKARIKKEKEIVKDVDEMIYLLAKAQHEMNIDIRKLWWNPNIALMKSIFTKWGCDYVKSTYLILDNIHKVETLLWNKIIPTDKENLLIKDSQKHVALKASESTFLMIASIPTLGIYYLFK